MAASREATEKTARLGRYEIVKHLAQGGMADVLLARTTGIEGFERHVVIKRIRAEQARDARYVEMFLDEARLAASLHHHNIAQVNDIGEEDGEYFFAMDYVHGEDARALLARVSQNDELIPLEHVLTIVSAAAAGLHHAHEQRGADRAPLGIVHRDVSPANILIGYDGAVKVADFGIAKAAQRTSKTRSGTLKGKVSYMSPEQCLGEGVDRRSDVFSLGIVLYELCTARRLFKSENDFLTMSSIVLGLVPAPTQFRPDLPVGLEAIILRALASKPEERYATADDLRRALEELAAELGLRMSTTALADYMKQQFGTRPEPWLEDELELEVELSIEFDGGSGVVQPPMAALATFAVPDFTGRTPPPIANAHRRVVARAETEHDGATSTAETVELPADEGAERSSHQRSSRWWMAGAIAAVAAAAIACWVLLAREAPGAAQDAPMPAAAPDPPAAAPDPQLSASPPMPPPPIAELVEPVVPTNLVDASSPVTVVPPEVEEPRAEPTREDRAESTREDRGEDSARTSKKRKRQRRSEPDSVPRWDPNALFPE